MTIEPDLEEAVFVRLKSISDERGYLTPVTDSISPSLMKRACIVGNNDRLVKRGIHYHKKEWKIYSVVTGAAKFISLRYPAELFDSLDFSGYPLDVAELQFKKEIDRYVQRNPESIKTCVISARSPGVFVIPAEHANGWVSLEKDTNIIFLSNLTYEEAVSDDYRFPPDFLGEACWGLDQ